MSQRRSIEWTEHEKLIRDIEGLREAIRLNYLDLDRLALSPDQRAGIKQNTVLLMKDLTELLARL
jgi:hypothetical protein